MLDISSDLVVFKALADSNRLRILDYLKKGKSCACDLSDNLGIPQTALSYHMRILCQAKLVKSEQVGKWKHYQLNDNANEQLQSKIDKYFHSVNKLSSYQCKGV
ncbi:ArsR/SmtB family transcription factor [Streptococcus parauberis]|uniref:Arsenical resistance operon repressor n=3 Tax=Streptococcus parauberis TaxID=1348 RepID=A0A0E2UGV6_9STRE|nr:metalloregulator ArsR/SmtB family transcription factor [Streptococcus parauberis]AUT04787.1 Transcriptional repressor SmtB [Streptococcus parauberis]EGE53745.1 putative arsenical resistance operon repressor [Streptococcus parauberis NCFD 2020]EMF48784.1 arsenical resistance operon repressor [Streptococcus parauberis KRS-02109]EMG24534.1 arsenical resistance operon repressor [Streptococcus parauberis KRS-02083]KYP21601.1 Arsenical resistance operon repressor [Streptococcus parauberis]